MRVNLQLVRKNIKVRTQVSPRQKSVHSARGGNSPQKLSMTFNSPRASRARHVPLNQLVSKIQITPTDPDSLCLPDIRKSPKRAISASASRRLEAANFASKNKGSFDTGSSDDNSPIVAPPKEWAPESLET